MEAIIISVLVIIAVLFLILSFRQESKPLGVIALILFLLTGSVVADSGIEKTIGVNSSLSDDNRSVLHDDLKEEIFVGHRDTFSFILFGLALFSLFAVVFS